MKGKVTCPNCGHSWNKSDSSVKDMHVCHNCGKSDVNMKNGGWLDNYADGGTMQEHQENYNDSQAYAPQGMVGDGFSNVGRNYSPAWGGQFQEGGEIPMAQSGRATRQDSLDVYNNAKKVEKYYKDKKYKLIGSNRSPGKELFEKNDFAAKEFKRDNYTIVPTKDGKNTYIPYPYNKYRQEIDKNKYLQRDNANTILDTRSPIQLFDKRINPQLSEDYINTKRKDPLLNDAISLSKYDPIAVKPFDLLTDAEKKLRVEKYGTSGVPKSYLNKKPQKQVIVKDPNAPKYRTVHTSDTEGRFELVERPKTKAIQNNLQSEGVESNFNLEADVPTIRPQAKLAKYFDVTDSVNQNFGGSESHYKYYPENGPLQELAPEPYNSRKIVPHYQMGGNVYPVNYVPQAQDGYQMGTYFDEDAREREPNMMEETYDDYNTAMTGMMKSKMATQAALGNPGARRMMTNMPAKYIFTGEERFSDGTPSGASAGTPGSHYMANRDNYTFPYLQDNGEGTLNFIPNASPSDREAMRFENADEADYFANHYKEVAPMMKHYGKMQMGGSLPGAVGFTYARVDGAPSNGPYAKKTMASAQNGQEMRYYQNGLDWKPKGMRDGGWLDEYEKAQNGTNTDALRILDQIYKRKTAGKFITPQGKIKNEREQAVTKTDNTRTTSKPKVTDVKKLNVKNKTEAELAEQERINNEAIAAERKAIREKANANPLNQGLGFFDSKNQTRQNWEDSTAGLESKFRVSDKPNFFDDWMNPLASIGGMAADLGASPNQIVQQDSMAPLIGAVAAPLLTGALEGHGTSNNKQFVNNLINPFNVVPGYKTVEKTLAMPIKKTLAKGALSTIEGMKSLKNKAFDLASSYRANNKKIMQKAIEDVNAGNAWSREWYSHPEIQNRYNEWISSGNKFIDPKSALLHSNMMAVVNPSVLGINLDKSFAHKISGTIARNNLEKLITEGGITKPVTSFGNQRNMLARYNHGANDALINVAHPGFNKGIFGKGFDVGNTVVHENIHSITKGDEGFKPEYLQKFKEPFQGLTGLTKHQKYLIKPTEVHARIGELRRTFGLTPETVVDDELMNHIINQGLKGKTSVEKNFFKLIKDKTKFKELMNTAPAGVIGVGLGSAALQQQKQGGVIKDDRGQWDHPGEITEIGSNQITMQGVPYDVLGISDTGDTKLMKPGKNYKFKGKKVTEFPMAKNGLRQEQKGLVNLDQLTNFTNYNKPQPGGWLSKYE